MQDFANEIVSEFTLSRGRLLQLKQEFSQKLQKGLQNKNEMLKCLPTFVKFLPTGSETGKFLTVDLGGTNLRVGLVELLGDGRFKINKDSCPLPLEIKRSGCGLRIFSFIAHQIRMFLQKPEIEAELPLQLGFTFSFPVEQETLAHGRILNWSKEILANDVLGRDAVELLQAELHALGLDIKVGSLVNDTVGTLVAQIYADDRTKISVILGTGSNAAYVEKQENIVKLGSASETGLTVINIEWGTFGDEEESLLPLTRFDRILDSQTSNCGKQRFEKMMSGMYLGEIVRHILLEAMQRNLIARFDAPSAYEMKTKSISQFIEAPSSESLAELLKVQGEVEPILAICKAVAARSALLCAAGIAAIYEHVISERIIGPDELCIVAVDGALYKRFHQYKEFLQETVCQLTTDPEKEMCKIELVMAEDLSSIGAAAAIASIPQ